MFRRIITLAACAALFSGCGGPGDSSGPRGWVHDSDGLWTNRRSQHDRFTAVSAPFDGTLKDLASQITTDVVLRNRGQYIRGVPFARCPGEAGLQTFTLGKARTLFLQVAFSVQNGRRVQASYQRGADEPDDPAAIDAMAANVCVMP